MSTPCKIGVRDRGANEMSEQAEGEKEREMDGVERVEEKKEKISQSVSQSDAVRVNLSARNNPRVTPRAPCNASLYVRARPLQC